MKWSVALLAILFVVIACSQQSDTFSFATVERGVSLPADHAAHPDFQTEWWYYTGHLRAADGRRFGFQLTWFRNALTTEQLAESKFKAKTVYFAHFTVTDKDGKTFRFAERISRGGNYDNAGADSRVLRTWIGDWVLEGLGSMFYMSARGDSMGLSLVGTPRKPAVLHGTNGYSQKGDQPTNASMYYSLPRIAVAGVLTLDSVPIDVEGEAWMDHEFGTSHLDSGQVGWDWFSLQLANNEEIMVYGLRDRTGAYHPRASGAYILSNGTRVPLAMKDYRIEVLEQWKSPKSAATYPAKWRITIPSQSFEAVVTPYIPDQELRTDNTVRVTYWEGAVSVAAKRNGAAVQGEGYVELTGYAKPLQF
ncbi:MAG: carotenoid 1,2-hydratase [bacterium]|nr:carotenoid 1,2-hydratase [Candidatus Kapabacteria bacterium]